MGIIFISVKMHSPLLHSYFGLLKDCVAANGALHFSCVASAAHFLFGGVPMDIYKKMYLRLFNQVTDAIEYLKKGCAAEAERILIQAQQNTENIYIESGED